MFAKQKHTHTHTTFYASKEIDINLAIVSQWHENSITQPVGFRKRAARRLCKHAPTGYVRRQSDCFPLQNHADFWYTVSESLSRAQYQMSTNKKMQHLSVRKAIRLYLIRLVIFVSNKQELVKQNPMVVLACLLVACKLSTHWPFKHSFILQAPILYLQQISAAAAAIHEGWCVKSSAIERPV